MNSMTNNEIIDYARYCIEAITGDEEEADRWEQSVDAGWTAIKACVELGIERNNELNKLKDALRRILDE